MSDLPSKIQDLKSKIVMAVAVTAMAMGGCTPQSSRTVIVYAAQDQVYAEPILQRFAQETNFDPRALYDSEAVKTVGLANRLLAEQSHPQCDVFWGNEELRTRQLLARGLWRSNDWARFGYRSRRLVINTNLVTAAQSPSRLGELTNQNWSGKVALAYPLFGTTSTHFFALRQHWGQTNWLQWCRGLAANHAKIVDGNSVVVQLVGRGEAAIGLTDSDDIAAGQRNGWPIMALPLSDEMLLIPNTVAVLARAPHPEAAQKLFHYLQRPEVLEALIAAGALEGRSPQSVPSLTVDWNYVLTHLETATRELETIFLR